MGAWGELMFENDTAGEAVEHLQKSLLHCRKGDTGAACLDRALKRYHKNAWGFLGLAWYVVHECGGRLTKAWLSVADAHVASELLEVKTWRSPSKRRAALKAFQALLHGNWGPTMRARGWRPVRRKRKRASSDGC